MVKSAPLGVDKLLEVFIQNDDVLRVKGYLPEGDGFVYLSDTGKGFERRITESAPVPLTVICTTGTGAGVMQTLLKQGLISI